LTRTPPPVPPGRATIVIIKREDKEKPSISFAEEVPSAEEAPKQVLPSLPPSTSPQSPPPESTHLLWKACKVDVKINVYSLAFSILTLPFLVLLMMQLGEGQFSDQFGSSELQLGSSETLSGEMGRHEERKKAERRAGAKQQQHTD